MPLAFRGGPAIPNIAISSPARPASSARQAKLIESMYLGALAPAVRGFTVHDEVYTSISAEMTARQPRRGLAQGSSNSRRGALRG